MSGNPLIKSSNSLSLNILIRLFGIKSWNPVKKCSI